MFVYNAILFVYISVLKASIQWKSTENGFCRFPRRRHSTTRILYQHTSVYLSPTFTPPPSPPPSPPNYTRLWIRIFSSLHDFPLWPEMWRITQKKSCARLFNVHYPQDGAARHDDMAVWRRRRRITARKMADAWRQNGGKILCAPRYNGLRRRCWGGGGGVHNKVYIHSTQPDDNIMAKGWLVKIIIIKTFIVSK